MRSRCARPASSGRSAHRPGRARATPALTGRSRPGRSPRGPHREGAQEPELAREPRRRSAACAPGHRVGEVEVLHLVMDDEHQDEGQRSTPRPRMHSQMPGRWPSRASVRPDARSRPVSPRREARSRVARRRGEIAHHAQAGQGPQRAHHHRGQLQARDSSPSCTEDVLVKKSDRRGHREVDLPRRASDAGRRAAHPFAGSGARCPGSGDRGATRRGKGRRSAAATADADISA